MQRTIEEYDREITIVVADKPDEHGQFRVSVVVDGKERWSAHFTDKTDYEYERRENEALYGFQDRHGRWPNATEQSRIRQSLGRG